jgi:hypothetical protein
MEEKRMARKRNVIHKTPIGETKFAWLTKADTKFNADGEYRTQFLVTPKQAEGLIEAIDEAIEAHREKVVAELKEKGKKGKALDIKMGNTPYKDDENADGEETGLISFNFKMKAKVTPKDGTPWEQKPDIFDAKGKPLVDTPVFSGSKVRIAFEMIPYFTAIAGCGISLRLKAVQVIELQTAERTAESFGFGEEEGYEHEGNPSDQADTGSDDAPEF